jgi:two-component system response regulator YesN
MMIKLLIADDEPLEREAIKFIIAANFPDCFAIREAENGRETIAQADQFHPELIFLDIKMPGCNGIKAAQAIRKIVPECRIVILSAYQHFNYAQSAISLGAVEYLTKPAAPAKIVATLTRVLKSIDETRLKKIQDAETARRLEQISKYLQDELLIRVVLGEIDIPALKSYFDVLQLHFQALLFAILRIANRKAVESQSEIDRTILQTDLLRYLNDKLTELGHHALIRSIGNDIYLLLLIHQELDEYQCRVFEINLFNEVKEDILHKFGVTVNIGMGSVTPNIEDIYTSFQEAKQSLEYDETPGTTTSFGDISKNRSHSAYPLYKEDQLLEQLIRGNLAKALDLLHEILDWFEANYSELALLKEKAYELLLVLARGIMLKANLDEFTIDTEFLRHSILTVESSMAIRTYAENFVTTKINEIKRIKKSRAGALMAIVSDYLEKNYAREISLEDVAASINISSFYLSKLFKKELGENFIDHLTGVRIRKAKEILVNPLHTVKDACYMVGYRDPNYFARVFKKISGMTPTEYQTKFMR